MNETHKLLLAFIDAMGYEVKEIKTPNGIEYPSYAGSPGFVDVMECENGLWRAYDIDYKVTKKVISSIKKINS